MPTKKSFPLSLSWSFCLFSLQSEIMEVKADVEAREAEAQRLQQEIEDARRQLEETTENMQRAAEMAALSAAAAAAARREEEAAQQNGVSSSSSSSSSGKLQRFIQITSPVLA